MLQPYGSLFFAAAPAFEGRSCLTVDATRADSVVIVRIRGRTIWAPPSWRCCTDTQALAAAGTKLVLVSTNERIDEQLRGRRDHRGRGGERVQR